MERWQNKWYPIGNKCTGLERTTSQTNISLAEAQGAFYILGIGLVLASLILFVEYVYKWRKRTKRTSTEDSGSVLMTYVGRVDRPKRASDKHRESVLSQKVDHDPRFASPFETTAQISTEINDTGQELNNANQMKKRKKSNSCPPFFGKCFGKDQEESLSADEGIANGAVKMRSAFSDTLWSSRKVSKSNGIPMVTHSQSNGTITQGTGPMSPSANGFTGFTFSYIRDDMNANTNNGNSVSETSNNKDAETGEESREIMYSIHL